MAISNAPDRPRAEQGPHQWALPQVQEAGLMLVILLLGVALSTLSKPVQDHGQLVNNFFRVRNIVDNVLTPMSWMAIMAVGVTFVIISGGIDISVGSIFGLSALGAAGAAQYFTKDSSTWLVLLTCISVPLAIGLGCGLLNGLLVVALRMHPFIVTLATLSIYRGLAQVVTTHKSLPFNGSLPPAFTSGFMMHAWRFPRADGSFMALEPWPMVVMLGFVAFGSFILRFTVWGRQVYAVGGNEEAARFSGLPVNWVKLRVYALSGLAAGLAGMVSASHYGSADTSTGFGYELMVVAAAVVGGASLLGGRGTALGAMLGMLIIQMIDNGISVLREISLGPWTLQLSKEYSRIIIGVAIVVAVAIDQFSDKLRNRRRG